ncbi:MAG: thermonuclease family protein [bacterium]|nr:thermonuclease family protein [bacterium]
MKLNRLALTLLALLVLTPAQGSTTRMVGVQFRGCYDGDTCYFDFPRVRPAMFGQDRPVRLLGIDAPEIKGDCPGEIQAAEQARDALVAKLQKARRIVIDTPGLDKYHRILGRVTADGLDLSAWMIRRGLAREYQGSHRSGWC